MRTAGALRVGILGGIAAVAVAAAVSPIAAAAGSSGGSADVPGETVFSAPLSDEVCSANGFGFRSIRIGYTNVATGEAGSVDVQPCTTFMGSPLDRVTAHTGSGPVVFTVSIVGQPSLPGFGGFIAP